MATSTFLERNGPLLAALLAALVVFGAIAALWLWPTGVDDGWDRPHVKSMMMQRKADAMEDLLDAMVHGRLVRASAAADRLDEYSETVEFFMRTDTDYRAQDEAFRASLDDLRGAADQGDLEAAKEATLQIERACLECHFLLLEEPADAWSR